MRPHMRALVRYLLAMALAAQFALAGLCLVHAEPDASAHVVHFPCAHQYQAHTAMLWSRRSNSVERTVKRPSMTIAPLGASLALLLPHEERELVAIQSQPNQADRAVFSARGPPCLL